MKIVNNLKRTVPFATLQSGDVFVLSSVSGSAFMKISEVYGKRGCAFNYINLSDGTRGFMTDDTFVVVCEATLTITNKEENDEN